MSASLVGSEMCIRDSTHGYTDTQIHRRRDAETQRRRDAEMQRRRDAEMPVSYTHLTLPTICSV
eukprot:6278439-Alexandrium_andersonii.AAC.1